MSRGNPRIQIRMKPDHFIRIRAVQKIVEQHTGIKLSAASLARYALLKVINELYTCNNASIIKSIPSSIRMMESYQPEKVCKESPVNYRWLLKKMDSTTNGGSYIRNDIRQGNDNERVDQEYS